MRFGSAPARLAPMNRIEKARWRNILRKAAKANRLFKKGYLVFDHFNCRFEGFKYCKKSNILYQGGDNCRVVWIGKKGTGWESAFDTPIKEYNAKRFDKWTAVHPKHIKKI